MEIVNKSYRGRNTTVDFMKGVLVCLMVLYHLNPFVGTKIGTLTVGIVYSFHMSGFLLISGFYANPEKSWKQFGKTLRSLVCLYVFFELFYAILLGVFGSVLHSS